MRMKGGTKRRVEKEDESLAKPELIASTGRVCFLITLRQIRQGVTCGYEKYC